MGYYFTGEQERIERNQRKARRAQAKVEKWVARRDKASEAWIEDWKRVERRREELRPT